MFLAAAFGQIIASNWVLGQGWKESFNSYTVYWAATASAADGTKLVAVGNSAPAGDSAIYTSADSGTSWVSNSAPFAYWSDVASSADGDKLVTVAYTGLIWISTDAGRTWKTATNAPVLNWVSVASSSDGARLAAAALSNQILTFTNGQPFPPLPSPVRPNGSIFTSSDSGATWVSNSIPCNCSPNPAWRRVVSSADGSQLFAVGGNAGLYHSTNGGVNWTNISLPISYAVSAASSADGSRLLATGYDDLGNDLWVSSTNSGQAWTTNLAPPGASGWRSVALSAEGTIMFAMDSATPIYMSVDSGITWMTTDAPRENWLAVACSAEGSKAVALAGYGKIFTWQYQPTLRLATSPTGTVITWPSTPLAAGFALQQNTNLTPSGWTDANAPISDDGTNLTASLGTPTNTLFFRLRK